MDTGAINTRRNVARVRNAPGPSLHVDEAKAAVAEWEAQEERTAVKAALAAGFMEEFNATHLIRLERATLVDVKLLAANGAWRIVFDIPGTEREKIPELSKQHQLAFVLDVSRRKRKRLSDGG